MNLEHFNKEGFAGPFKLFDQAQAEDLLKTSGRFHAKLGTWYKSIHEKSKSVCDIASSPLILDEVMTVLGNDVLLWGSIIIGQSPNGKHIWHLDVEHGSWNGVTVWLGLKDLNEKTTLSLISKSHLLNSAPQELAKKFGIDTSDYDAVLQAAKKENPLCELKTFTMQPGEFVIWSGKLWHATDNRSDKIRYSLILQYCTPKDKVKMPVTYDYPDTKWDPNINPPCVLLNGEDRFNINKVKRSRDVGGFKDIINTYYSIPKQYGYRYLYRTMIKDFRNGYKT